ncbi:MAG: GH3 auxin-responsive promoter family protein [Bacteroidales bacterium]|nr:GH3 auxin-responsive promoter family protein [Bacteroidales bacterium]
MIFINSLVSWLIKKRIHQIDLFVKYPIEVQQELLRKLLSTASNTYFGKKYNFKDIRSIREFQEQVPLHDYNSLKIYIDDLMQGKQNILWPSDIKWFAQSSGTTSDKSKYIPVSFETLEECHYRGSRDAISFYYHHNPQASIFSGKGLILGGSHKLKEINQESYYIGDLSAILLQNMPFIGQIKSTPELSIALMDEWESKIDQIAQTTANHNVTSLSGVPSWTLVLIRKILEQTGKSNLLEVWPNLELFFHGGVAFHPYKDQFKKLIPSENMKYIETYNASEGFFAIQNEPDKDDMLLMLDYGVFYEFILMDHIEQANPEVITLANVVKGKNYAMIITTNSGLWRYMIGDTVTFTSTYPFKIKITGRTRHFINAFGEELIIENAEKALSIACHKCNALISEYTAAPCYIKDNHSGAHEWLIEFELAPSDIAFFAEVLDNALKSLNSDYEAKRYNNMILKPPIIHMAKKGTFYAWLKNKGKLGGQHKVPRLANDRKFMDDILSMKLWNQNFSN